MPETQPDLPPAKGAQSGRAVQALRLVSSLVWRLTWAPLSLALLLIALAAVVLPPLINRLRRYDGVPTH